MTLRWSLVFAVALLLPAMVFAGGERSHESATFGPQVVIEDIEVTGNDRTSSAIIADSLPFAVGDRLHSGGRSFADARYKVLALGFFRDVRLQLRRGSRRGQVIIVVDVVERGTISLDRLHFGRTHATPWWAGLELGERNFLGTGLGIGGGFLVTGDSDVEPFDRQWAAQLHVERDRIGGTPVGLFATSFWIDAAEPLRIAGTSSDSPLAFSAARYRRIGGRAGLSYQATSLSRLVAEGRYERVKAESLVEGLSPGQSNVATVSFAVDRDSRPHPILPWTGSRLTLRTEIGWSGLGSDSEYLSVLGQAAVWRPLAGRAHVLSLHLTGAAVIGSPPLFERLYVGTLDRWMAPREMGLVLSTRDSVDIFGLGGQDRYGDYGGVFESQYSYRLFRGGKRVYGGDIFIGAGLWALGTTDVFVSGFVDGGLRLDTELGIFELSIANGVGRLPF